MTRCADGIVLDNLQVAGIRLGWQFGWGIGLGLVRWSDSPLRSGRIRQSLVRPPGLHVRPALPGFFWKACLNFGKKGRKRSEI